MESDQDRRGTGRDPHLWHSCLAPTWAMGLFFSDDSDGWRPAIKFDDMGWSRVEEKWE